MKINITKKEYRLLLDILYISDWIMHSREVHSRSAHHALRKKFLSYYKEMEAEDAIEYATEDDEYYESRVYEEDMHHQFIDPYDEEVFWEALADRLAERDLIKTLGLESFRSLDGMDRAMKLSKVAEQYENEFEQHGLEHIAVSRGKAVIN